MPHLQANWYNLNAGRRYPLSDMATGTDDKGLRLHDDILVDCHLRFPITAGRHAFVGGVTVTNTLVTVVFLGSMTASSTRGRFVPLGAVTVVKPGNSDVHYPIQPLYPGVGGFVAFGDISEVFAARFSTPQQSLLAPRCARSYNPLPVTELRKRGVGTGLTGLVTVIGEDDIEVVKETIVVTHPTLHTYETVDALVIRLRQEVGGVNVLEKYIGPCGNRPESGNCEKKGIELINDARPDCNGNINFDFRSMTVGLMSECGGLTLDTSIGMDTICQDFAPDRFRGRDSCRFISSSSSSSSSSSAQLPLPPPLLFPSALSAPILYGPLDATPCHRGTVCTSFEDPDDKYLVWNPLLVSNYFGRADEAPGVIAPDNHQGDPSESCWSPSSLSSSSFEDSHSLVIGNPHQRSIWLLKWCSSATPVGWDQFLVADMQITSGPCGLILGWRVFGTGLTENPSYYAVFADPATSMFKIWWYPGREPPVLVGQRSFSPHRIRSYYWYRWKAHITMVSDDPVPHAIINASLESVNDPDFQRVSFSFATRRYAKLSSHGVGAERGASARVSWMSLK